MNFESYLLIGIGIVLAIAGLALPRRVTKLKIRNFQGNMSTGDVSGQMHQTYTSTSTAPVPTEKPRPIGVRDIVGWVIALLGVAVTAWGVYLGQFSD